MLFFPFVQTVLLPRSVVAAGLHDLLQRLLDSIPIVRLCGNGQSKLQFVRKVI